MTPEKIHALNTLYAVNPLDPKSLLVWAGSWALWIVIFAETGLLIGFFLPGDTLLFLAGVASSQFATQIVGTQLPFVPLLIVTPLCAIAGAQTGHYLGRRYGVKMFDRPNSRIFKREYVVKTEETFERFGVARAIVLARFIPIVRTFLNPVAGILGVPPMRFFSWNVVGGIIWVDGILIAGNLLAKKLGETFNVDKFILPVIIMLVVIAALPLLIDIVRKRRAKQRGRHAG